MSETTSYYKKVASVTVTNGGSDYTSAPTVTIGGNATATATISGGKVTAITVTAAGYNYLTPPTITFTGGVLISYYTVIGSFSVTFTL